MKAGFSILRIEWRSITNSVFLLANVAMPTLHIMRLYVYAAGPNIVLMRTTVLGKVHQQHISNDADVRCMHGVYNYVLYREL